MTEEKDQKEKDELSSREGERVEEGSSPREEESLVDGQPPSKSPLYQEGKMLEEDEEEETYSGFVAVIGRTNVGKSTLVNALLAQKVSIVTEKPQTTTLLVKGILTEGNKQAVFVDTPGLHRPMSKYSEMMLGDIPKALEDIDLIVAVVEPGDEYKGGTKRIIDMIKDHPAPRILLINKIDIASKNTIMPTAEMLGEECTFDLVLPISALEGENIDYLRKEIFKRLPQGPFFYPEDMVTDLPQPLYVAEVIREKAMQLTEEEVPHCLGVVVKELREKKNGAFFIRATLYVERESLKPILIGKGGSMIKEIGTLARKELEKVTERKVILKTHVKVMKNWRNEQAHLFRPDS